MAMEDGRTAGGGAGRRTPVIRGGRTVPPKPPRPRLPPTRNTFVSEIGRPLFEGVDLDSHLERFVLDAVDGELPAPTAPATPPPAPKVAARPPPLKPRAPVASPKPSATLLPDLVPQRAEGAHVGVAAEKTPRIRGALESSPQLEGSPGKTPQLGNPPDLKTVPPAAGVEAQPVQEAAPVEPVSAAGADVEAVVEPSPRQDFEPRLAIRGTSEASGMIVDALPPPEVSTPPATRARLSEHASTVLDQLRRVPREAWETGAAALLGGVIGYQASSLLMWLMG